MGTTFIYFESLCLSQCRAHRSIEYMLVEGINITKFLNHWRNCSEFFVFYQSTCESFSQGQKTNSTSLGKNHFVWKSGL